MKKFLSVILTLVLIVCVFSGCGIKDTGNGKLNIVTTIFPEYDWVNNILGEKSSETNITMLLDNGVDLHSFQPSADDIIKISTCDVFIYIGGESDGWVEDALKEATNQNMSVINLMDALGSAVKEEEQSEGMQNEAEEHEDEEDEKEYDEHIWLSLKNAKIACKTITDVLCEKDSENAEIYNTNLESYISSLTELDNEYNDVVSNAENKTLVFADRFPFRYLTDDYGIKYYAAFSGCSAETEASFETVTSLSKQIDTLSLNYVITIEGSKAKIAETVIANTQNKNASVLSLNSLQSVTQNDVNSGVTYLQVMKDNLNVLKIALN